MRPPSLLFALCALAVVGCDKPAPPAEPSPAPSASAAAQKPAPSATAAASAAVAPVAAAGAWVGTYTAKVGEVDTPKAAHEKTWKQDPGTASVGAGTIELTVSGPRGAAVGVAKGALGELLVSGVLDDKELRANLSPKDPNAEGAMTGWLVARREGNALKGTLRVSGRDAKIVREGDVQLGAK